MRDTAGQQLNRIRSVKHRVKRWQRLVMALCCVVVFCTVYALILPAITETRTLTCTRAEHTHTEACYTEITVPQVLSCTLEESETHTHDESCYTPAHTEKILICDIPEHLHDDIACYDDGEGLLSEYICDMGAHTHTDACYSGETLLCTLPEHTHTALCCRDYRVEPESREDWEATLPAASPTGDRGSDLLLTAQTQLGTRESRVYYELSDTGEKKGYTRYGDWYGTPFADWNALFADFCLSYAGIEEETLYATPEEWFSALTEEARLTGDSPAPGNILFFAEEGERGELRMGILESIGEDGILITLSGDTQESVSRVGVSPDAVKGVLSYADAPEEAPAETLTAEETEVPALTASTTYIYTKVSYPSDGSVPSGSFAIAYVGSYTAVRGAMSNVADGDFLKRVTLSEVGSSTISSSSALTLWSFEKSGSGVKLYTGSGSSKQYLSISSSKLWLGSSGSTFTVTRKSDGSFTLGSGGYYINSSGGSQRFIRYEGGSELTLFSGPEIDTGTPAVWLDGTCGGLMSLVGADNKLAEVSADGSVTLPTTWKSTPKYDYVLKGWYDIYNSAYYAPGTTVTVSDDTVFYADWIARTYDVGQTDGAVSSLDTQSFIRTNVFDYGALFNVQTRNLNQSSSTLSSGSHQETWTHVTSGTVNYQNLTTLEFAFMDWDWDNPYRKISSAYTGDGYSENKGYITSGVIANSDSLQSGRSLIDTLFGTDTEVIGKEYVGSANYLFQYMDKTTSNYDNEHNGFYYYDSKLNAASYNQSQKRFYVYSYLERTDDSRADGGDGIYSDFLPFNSPTVNNNEGTVIKQTCAGKTVYKYDAKDTGNAKKDTAADKEHMDGSTENQNDLSHATTNYWIGMSVDIDFYLPNDTGSIINKVTGNRSVTGEEMVFEFSGDDDVWVFIENCKTGENTLVLDIGGVHGVATGEINFSTGKYSVYPSTQNKTTLSGTVSFESGDYTLHLYYLERGGSQSNCSIYFNLVPRYTLELTKRDADDATAFLSGAEFTVYDDEACTTPSTLWNGEGNYHLGVESSSTFVTDESGHAVCWGLLAGHTYYIRETKPPDGYYPTKDILKIQLSNTGEMTPSVIRSSQSAVGGFELLASSFSSTTSKILLTVGNQKLPTVSLNAEKKWLDAMGNSCQAGVTSIFADLYADGVKTETQIELTGTGGWKTTLSGLSRYRVAEEDGDYVLYEISYELREADPPEGYGVTYQYGGSGETKTATIVNRKLAYRLPSTGGPGNALYIISGGLLLLAALWIVFKKKLKYIKKREGNTMKKALKALSLMLVLVSMTLTLLPCAATEPKTAYTVTIDPAPSAVDTYAAYQVFAGVLNVEDETKTLSDITWGKNVDSSKLADMEAELVTAGLATETDKSAATVASGLTDSTSALKFADIVSKYLTGTPVKNSTAAGSISIPVADAGYYLIQSAGDTSSTAATRFVMQVVADCSFSPKVSYPTVDKVIVEGSTDVKANQAAFGDTVTYKITSKVPDMAYYNGYYFTITDTLQKGLTFQAITSVQVDGQDADYHVVNQPSTDKPSANQTFTVVLEDFIQYKEKTGKDIVLTYTATLNDQANLGTAEGNFNKVYLEYSNNPNFDYAAEIAKNKKSGSEVLSYEPPKKSGSETEYSVPIGKTAEVTVKTYTTELVLTKTDGTNALTGAAFELKCGDTVIVPSGVTAVDGKYYVGTDGKLTFKGLDAGTYTLTETATPAGYNAISAVTFTIAFDADTPEISVTGLEDATATNGLIAANVVNTKGSVLPTTGGIGTTLFYVIGGVAVFVAVVLLITRKRISRNS